MSSTLPAPRLTSSGWQHETENDLRESSSKHIATHPPCPHAETSLLRRTARSGVCGARQIGRGPPRNEGLGTTSFTEMTAMAARKRARSTSAGFPPTDGRVGCRGGRRRAPERRRREPVRALPRGPCPCAGQCSTISATFYGLEPEDLLVRAAPGGVAAALRPCARAGDEVSCERPY